MNMNGTDRDAERVTKVGRVGFTDPAGRFFPVAFTPRRVELALDLGIDLAAAMASPGGPARLLGDGATASLVRIVQTAIIAAGGDDQEPPGVALADEFISPEDFARVMANPKTFGLAAVAILDALAAHFPGTPGSRSINTSRPRLRAKGR